MKKKPFDGSLAAPDAEKLLPEAARRALAEAEARRRERQIVAGDASKAATAIEIEGRGGLEPVRFGDWEVKGLASDF